MKIQKIVVGSLFENCYIVSDEKAKAIVIDPGAEGNKICEFLSPYQVKGILVTHYHFDHIGALEELKNIYQVPVNDFTALKKDFLFEVYKMPGHTLDSQSFYFPTLHSLFVGDFVFQQGIGRTDLGGSNLEMKKSIVFLLHHFDNETILYPGHGRKTTLKEETEFLKNVIS